MAIVQRKNLSANKLAGRNIHQDEARKRTVYSNSLMKGYGYIINDENAAEYYNYSLRTIEALFGASVVTVLTSKLIIGLSLGLIIHGVLSFLFYQRFLKKLPKTERFEKHKNENYIVSMSNDLTVSRLILVISLLLITSYVVIYASKTKEYTTQMKNLMVAVHILISAFTLLNIYTLIYKIIKKN